MSDNIFSFKLSQQLVDSIQEFKMTEVNGYNPSHDGFNGSDANGAHKSDTTVAGIFTDGFRNIKELNALSIDGPLKYSNESGSLVILSMHLTIGNWNLNIVPNASRFEFGGPIDVGGKPVKLGPLTITSVKLSGMKCLVDAARPNLFGIYEFEDSEVLKLGISLEGEEPPKTTNAEEIKKLTNYDYSTLDIKLDWKLGYARLNQNIIENQIDATGTQADPLDTTLDFSCYYLIGHKYDIPKLAETVAETASEPQRDEEGEKAAVAKLTKIDESFDLDEPWSVEQAKTSVKRELNVAGLPIPIPEWLWTQLIALKCNWYSDCFRFIAQYPGFLIKYNTFTGGPLSPLSFKALRTIAEFIMSTLKSDMLKDLNGIANNVCAFKLGSVQVGTGAKQTIRDIQDKLEELTGVLSSFEKYLFFSIPQSTAVAIATEGKLRSAHAQYFQKEEERLSTPQTSDRKSIDDATKPSNTIELNRSTFIRKSYYDPLTMKVVRGYISTRSIGRTSIPELKSIQDQYADSIIRLLNSYIDFAMFSSYLHLEYNTLDIQEAAYLKKYLEITRQERTPEMINNRVKVAKDTIARIEKQLNELKSLKIDINAEGVDPEVLLPKLDEIKKQAETTKSDLEKQRDEFNKKLEFYEKGGIDNLEERCTEFANNILIEDWLPILGEPEVVVTPGQAYTHNVNVINDDSTKEPKKGGLNPYSLTQLLANLQFNYGAGNDYKFTGDHLSYMYDHPKYKTIVFKAEELYHALRYNKLVVDSGLLLDGKSTYALTGVLKFDEAKLNENVKRRYKLRQMERIEYELLDRLKGITPFTLKDSNIFVQEYLNNQLSFSVIDKINQFVIMIRELFITIPMELQNDIQCIIEPFGAVVVTPTGPGAVVNNILQITGAILRSIEALHRLHSDITYTLDLAESIGIPEAFTAPIKALLSMIEPFIM